MGLIQLVQTLLGGNGKAVKELAEVFKVNAEASDARGHDLDTAALNQFAAEFVARSRRTWWDSLVDGLNRLPRPAFTLGVFMVLVWTARDPAFMAEVFTTWAIIPAPVWVLITAIVTFFFGGRAQAKDLDFQRDLASVMSGTQAALAQRRELRALGAGSATTLTDAPAHGTYDDNPALADWRAIREG
ncbi:3TM-type holin [Sagittula salina]|uniref:Carboxylesterase n=1 Tax=Sagittula salina TaxID=2820268 RepID=A0A940MW49_9RHOB|nr:3TM-type holin [Sagittula salina]MBP0483959.1 carboxylesterase [Sagittula salina]